LKKEKEGKPAEKRERVACVCVCDGVSTSGLRSYTTSSWPFFSKFAAIPAVEEEKERRRRRVREKEQSMNDTERETEK
jgi:hypothetical protein